MIKEYLLQNWSLILVLAVFAIALRITVFWDEKTIKRMYVLIIGVYLLSLVVFVEFNCTAQVEYRALRSILMAIRYSATPFIISQIIYTLVKKQTLYIFIPSIILTVIDFVSIFTGIVFRRITPSPAARWDICLSLLPGRIALLWSISFSKDAT